METDQHTYDAALAVLDEWFGSSANRHKLCGEVLSDREASAAILAQSLGWILAQRPKVVLTRHGIIALEAYRRRMARGPA